MKAHEKQHLDRIASMPCALCSRLGVAEDNVEVHHLRTGQGTSQRASHYLTVPLCAGCHRGAKGIHGDQTLLRIAKVSELDLLADTIARLVE